MIALKGPSSADIKAARTAAGWTQDQASNAVYRPLDVWQQWESGQAEMPLVFWHLFLFKSSPNYDPMEGAAPDAIPEHERAKYVASLMQIRASFALEDMHPNFDSEVIEACVLAGLVSPEHDHREMLAYVDKHKKMSGFMESRPWTAAMRAKVLQAA